VAKKTVTVLSAGVICFLVVACIHFFSSADTEQILIKVKKGDSFASVAARLKGNKLIHSKNLFLGFVKLTKSQGKLRAGVYSFSKKDGMFKILKNLKNGSKNALRFTVPEGNNIKQIADIVSQTIDIDKEKFVKIAQDKNLEGYLMPETYFVVPGETEEDIIKMMGDEFNKKIMPEMYGRAKEMNVAFKDIVIMASIIEKETVAREERQMIAAVFYNRLKKRIRLQSCATVLYAMGVNKTKLTIEDTKFDSPYNTYRHFGLPPGPICNPGIESIKAALYPADTKSLFFVSDGNGRHLFAKNLVEHKQNRQKSKLEKKRTEKLIISGSYYGTEKSLF
jgi:UPF0755 protein